MITVTSNQLQSLTSSEQVKALCDGKIDAFGYSVGFPNGAMEQAATCAAKALAQLILTGAGPVKGSNRVVLTIMQKQ